MYKDDGTPISSSSLAMGRAGSELSVAELVKLRAFLQKTNDIHLGVVTGILFSDNPDNMSKNQVEYEIQLEFGERQGQQYSNVKAITLYGGNVQISETIYYPRTKLLKGSNLKDNIYMFDHDGSQVVVAFMDGYPNRPFIIGGWANTNMDPAFAATAADGIRKIEEFNGMRLNIDSDGEYILTYYGGQRDTKTKITVNAGTAPTTLKIDKTGAFSIDDKENQLFKIDRVAKTITLSQSSAVKPNEIYGDTDSSAPGSVVNSIVMDKGAKTITITAGSVSQIYDGTGDAFKLMTTGGAEINLVGGKIAIGASGTELLNEITTALGDIISFLNSDDSTHTHLGNLGYPTGAPINASTFTALASSLMTIQSALNAIKGSL